MTIEQVLYSFVFIALLGVPFFAALKVRKRYIGVAGFALVVVISTLVMSGTVITQWLFYEWYLQDQIEPLDRNGDGFWTNDEISTWTKKDHENMDAYMSDGGRNVFSAIIFPIVALAYSFIVTSLCWIVGNLSSRRKSA